MIEVDLPRPRGHSSTPTAPFVELTQQITQIFLSRGILHGTAVSEEGLMRVAMLGVGHWHAGMHAKGVLEAGAEIVGVWDPDVGAVARFVDACGGIARTGCSGSNR